jgi:riboflavin synthase alpha subunit
MVGKKRTAVQVEVLTNAMVDAVQKKVPEGKISVDGTSLTVELVDAEARTPDIVQALVQAGGRVHSAGVVASSLEETYLKLVRRDQ